MTEAEKRVIEVEIQAIVELLRRRDITRYDAFTRVVAMKLGLTRDEIYAKLDAAMSASPPPAPAVDVAGLEAEIARHNDVIAKLIERFHSLEWPVDISLKLTDAVAARRVAKEALAAARKPKPALLSIGEADMIFRTTDDHKASPMGAVLSAATERFVAAVEGLPRYATITYDGGDRLEQHKDGGFAALSDIRALAAEAERRKA